MADSTEPVAPTPAEPKKKKGFPLFKLAVLVIVLLVIGGLAFVYLNLDNIIRDRIEVSAESSLDLETDLDSVTLGLLSGDVDLNELAIASPEGFTAPRMFSVGGLSVDTSYGELLGDPVRVADINIASPKIVLEQAGGKFNIKVLGDKFAGDSAPDEPADGESEPIRLIIDKLTVTNAQVEIIPGIPGIEPLSLTVPDVVLNNIGTAEGAENGAEVGRVVMEVMTAIGVAVAQNEDLPPQLRAILSGDLQAMFGDIEGMAQEQLDKALGNLTDKLPPEAGDLLEGEVGDRAKDALGNLFGGNKDDEE
jgi:hypothetical protein